VRRRETLVVVEILIIGSIGVEPGRRRELLEAIAPLVGKTRGEEPGCLEYAFTADTIEPGRVVVVEHWRDQATLAAHFEHPNFLATKQALHDHGSLTSSIRKYRVDLGEPVRDSDKRYRADFFTAGDARDTRD
jgi:quinol monooxygenase YgiN